jgi:hypothetical protein
VYVFKSPRIMFRRFASLALASCWMAADASCLRDCDRILFLGVVTLLLLLDFTSVCRGGVFGNDAWFGALLLVSLLLF